jgi:hypothetical protein
VVSWSELMVDQGVYSMYKNNFSNSHWLFRGGDDGGGVGGEGRVESADHV